MEKTTDVTTKYNALTSDVIAIIVNFRPVKPIGIEPGVEIAQALSPIIATAVEWTVNSNDDLSDVSKGILIGAFRCDRSISLEAHKTLRLIIQEIIQSVSIYKGDIDAAINGILNGVIAVAQEHRLNNEQAFVIAREDISYSLDKLDIELNMQDLNKITQEDGRVPVMS